MGVVNTRSREARLFVTNDTHFWARINENGSVGSDGGHLCGVLLNSRSSFGSNLVGSVGQFRGVCGHVSSREF